MSDRISACRSCGEDVDFYKTVNDKWMPVNLDADPAGNVRVNFKEGTVEVLAGFDLLEAQTDPDVKLRRSHFATCKDADSWRNGSRQP